MTPSTFYNYYRDKDALRDELLATVAGRMLETLSGIRAKARGADEYLGMASRALFEGLVANQTTAMLLRRNLPLLRSLLDDKSLRPVYAALRRDLEAAAGADGQRDALDGDFSEAVLRAASVEISVVLLSQPDPDVNAAVEFMTRVLGTAFRFHTSKNTAG